MANQLPMKLTKTQLDEFNALLGPAPVLSTENEHHYKLMWRRLIECFAPEDFMVLLLVRQVQDATWTILRYGRHQTLGIERRFRESAEFQAKRKKEQFERSEASAEELADKSGRPITELSEMNRRRGLLETLAEDVDEFDERTPKEFDHNRALEAGIFFQQHLDRLTNSALARRNNALEQLELYRAGLGQYWRQVSDEIIYLEATEIKEEANRIDAPPVTPDDQEIQEFLGPSGESPTSGERS